MLGLLKKGGAPAPNPAEAGLAAAEAAVREADAAVQTAEEVLLGAAAGNDPAALAEAAQRLSAARVEAAQAADVAAVVRRAAEQRQQAAALAELERLHLRFEALAKELERATAQYREGAATTWRAAEAIERIREEAVDLRSQARPLWSNAIAARFGRPLPGCDFETPDLTLLRLPEAGAKGETLADPVGVDVEASAAWTRAVVAARTARAAGRREGVSIGRALPRW